MHYSVLLTETIDMLKIKEDGIYVDATLGYGGHSSLLLRKLKRGFLFAFDQDIEAIKYADNRLASISDQYKIIKDNFVNMKERLLENKITTVDGVIFDLGVSSPQLDDGSRGFSYNKDAKLDMRMDQSNNFSAYDVINKYSYDELVRIFHEYGEEKYASRIASKIISNREIKDIETTIELSNIINSCYPAKERRDGNPSRKVFQAVRIEVNHELEVLDKALNDMISILNKDGRICVITFHSLEDRMVKKIFKKYSEVDNHLRNLPFIPEDLMPKYRVINKDVIIPSEDELNENNRSRSAKLRVIERIG